MSVPEAWLVAFAQDQGLCPDATRTLSAATTALSLAPGTTVFEAGVPCRAYTLIRSGQVRVHQLEPGGGEIVLYRLGPGSTCVLNTAALIADENYAAYATTETAVDAMAISPAGFAELLAISEGFRSFVFRSHAARIAALMRVICEVTFERIDVRLARRLVALAGAGREVTVTHAHLATELGTAREVVSRNLERLASRGVLSLGKGTIAIVDPEALRVLGQGEPGR